MLDFQNLGNLSAQAMGTLRKYWYLGVLGAVISGIGGYVGFLAEREFQVRRERRLLRKRANKVNIGAIFGMDVGGTLTKIVYFEKDTEANLGETADERANYVDVVTQGTSEADVKVQRAKSSDGADASGGLTRRFNKSETNFLAEDARERRKSLTGNDQSSPEAAGDKSGLIRKASHGSLAKLDAPDHQAALKELYEYMNSTRNDPNAASSNLLHDQGLSFYSSYLGGRLHFLNFETRNMVNAIDLLSMQGEAFHNVRTIACTGGGAHKYAAEVEEYLAVTFDQMDELACLIRGMHFALTNVEDECYTYRKPITTGAHASSRHEADGGGNSASAGLKEYTERVVLPPSHFMKTKEQFPYLVVNIGTGVSIMKITSPGVFERVSGSSVGGGTYWGLCRLLLHSAAGAGKGAKSFQHILELAEQGDPNKVDMLVKDIYGGSYEEKTTRLDGEMVASSFGKLTMKEEPGRGVSEGDIAIALLMMITNNLGQVSYLNAQLHGCKKIFFVGSFLRQNTISCRRLSYAIDFWSRGAMEALFLVHEGYFGSLGSFLSSAFGKDVDKILHTHEYLGEDGSPRVDQEAGSVGLEGLDAPAVVPQRSGRSRAHSASVIVVGDRRPKIGQNTANTGGGADRKSSSSTGGPSFSATKLFSSMTNAPRRATATGEITPLAKENIEL
jgi:type II pantothenate kinase